MVKIITLPEGEKRRCDVKIEGRRLQDRSAHSSSEPNCQRHARYEFDGRALCEAHAGREAVQILLRRKAG